MSLLYFVIRPTVIYALFDVSVVGRKAIKAKGDCVLVYGDV